MKKKMNHNEKFFEYEEIAGGKDSLNSEKEIAKEEREWGMGNWCQTLFIMFNSSIGSGILTYPYSYMSGGFVTGIIFTVIVGTLASLTMFFLEIGLVFALRKGIKIHNYQDLIGFYCGPVLQKIVEVISIFYMAGGCISYLTVIGDSLQPIIQFYVPENIIFCERKMIISICSILVLFPLTLKRNISGLSSASFFANINVFLLVLLVVIYFFATIVFDSTSRKEYHVPHDLWVFSPRLFDEIIPTFVISLPLMAFSFQSHVSIAPVFDSLKVKSLFRISSITFLTFLMTGIIYMAVGVCGFLQFQGYVDPDFLMTYPANGIASNFGRVLIGVVVTLTYPIKFFMDRLALETLLFDHDSIRKFFFDVRKSDDSDQSVESSTSTENKNGDYKVLKTFPFLILTLVIFISTLLITLYVPDIVSVVGIVGSFGSTTLMFVFPNLMMIMLIYSEVRISFFKKLVLYIFLALFSLFGMLICVLGILTTTLKIRSGEVQ